MEALASTRLAKGHYSIAEVRDHWYIACRSKDLKGKPVAATVYGVPIVLFRHEGGRPSALLDRCAHRNVPLSLGDCEGERLVCAYHGWEYDGAGVCQKVPALCGPQTGKARRVPAFACVEKQGFVWVYASPDSVPQVEPFTFPFADDPKYGSVVYTADFEATLHATLENILDVPHTAFLHRGLFRGVKRNEITAVVRRRRDRVEAEYVGEPRPTGLLGAILAPGGGTIAHFDRFILPSVAQVEYALGPKNHVIVSSALTPVSDFLTRLFAVVTFKVALPRLILRALLTPIGKRVAKQDAEMLRRQTEAVQRFGGEQFVSTDVDILGPHVLRMLRQAERGEIAAEGDDAMIAEEQVRLLA
jgi:phenylpropionate dioxygenase-like ring-hydroxylating dioxygenase large terminal subunit